MVVERLVVVALVPVALEKVKFCKVEEAFTKRLPKVPRPVAVMEFAVKRPLALMLRAETEEVAPRLVDEVAR